MCNFFKVVTVSGKVGPAHPAQCTFCSMSWAHTRATEAECGWKPASAEVGCALSVVSLQFNSSEQSMEGWLKRSPAEDQQCNEDHFSHLTQCELEMSVFSNYDGLGKLVLEEFPKSYHLRLQPSAFHGVAWPVCCLTFPCALSFVCNFLAVICLLSLEKWPRCYVSFLLYILSFLYFVLAYNYKKRFHCYISIHTYNVL